MIFNIKPYTISQTAVQLTANIVGITDEVAMIDYQLVRADGRVIESGVKHVPLSTLAIVAQNPMPVADVNQLLTTWNIELANP